MLAKGRVVSTVLQPLKHNMLLTELILALPPFLPSGCSCFLGTAVMEWGMDMVLRRKPAGRVSMEPGIIPRPWPSLGLKRLRHDGDLRNDLSSHCEDQNN